MTQRTTVKTLTTSWAEISAGEGTVLVSMPPSTRGNAELAVGLLADYDANKPGHTITPDDRSNASFYGLGTNRVLARKRVSSETVTLVVTAF